MRILPFMISLLLTISISANDLPVSVTFYQGDFESAKVKAGDEGKLFFVDFYANWCTPCKWMDETTFKDREVVGLLNANYVALKIDIDEIEGYGVKQKFQVTVLPTMLIFNSKGELIARVEETLSASKLSILLSHHNKDENKIRVKHAVNSSPRISLRSTAEQVTEAHTPMTSPSPRIQHKDQKFQIQLGVFGEFENSYELVRQLKSKFIEPIIVLNDIKNGAQVYKVMMGSFKTRGEAEGFNEILKREFDLSGMVKGH